MKKINYTIIIPVYNAEETIKRCIDIILAEKEPNIEIVLVNDGSTDKSLSICESYSNEHENIVVINKVNGGAASARNAGLSKASGKYVTFVDSDDAILPGYFDNLNRAGDADLVIFGITKFDGIAKKENIPSAFLSTCDSVHYIIKSRDGSPCNKRFKRVLLTASNSIFPVDLDIGEDFIFCLKYALYCQSIQYIYQSFYLYDTSRLGSLTRRFHSDYIEQAIQIYKCAFHEVEIFQMNLKIKEDLLGLLDYNYCRTAFACAAIAIKYQSSKNLNIEKEISKIIQLFLSYSQRPIRIVGVVHRLMRFCLTKKVKFIIFIVAKIAG